MPRACDVSRPPTAQKVENYAQVMGMTPFAPVEKCPHRPSLPLRAMELSMANALLIYQASADICSAGDRFHVLIKYINRKYTYRLMAMRRTTLETNRMQQADSTIPGCSPQLRLACVSPVVEMAILDWQAQPPVSSWGLTHCIST